MSILSTLRTRDDYIDGDNLPVLSRLSKSSRNADIPALSETAMNWEVPDISHGGRKYEAVLRYRDGSEGVMECIPGVNQKGAWEYVHKRLFSLCDSSNLPEVKSLKAVSGHLDTWDMRELLYRTRQVNMRVLGIPEMMEPETPQIELWREYWTEPPKILALAVQKYLVKDVYNRFRKTGVNPIIILKGFDPIARIKLVSFSISGDVPELNSRVYGLSDRSMRYTCNVSLQASLFDAGLPHDAYAMRDFINVAYTGIHLPDDRCLGYTDDEKMLEYWDACKQLSPRLDRWSSPIMSLRQEIDSSQQRRLRTGPFSGMKKPRDACACRCSI